MWKGPLVPRQLPMSLLELDLSATSFDSPLVLHALPPALRSLRMSMRYSQSLTEDSLAACQQLEELVLPSQHFTQLLTAQLLPLSLRLLQLHPKYAVEQLRLPSTVLVSTRSY